jgi:hypothetical protein
MTDTPDRDPCDELLSPGPPPPDERLRAAIRRETLAGLRRRHWRRQSAVAAALAACYLLGLGTARLAREPNPPMQVTVQPTKQPAPRPAQPAVAPSPLALEWQALDSPEARPELARLAGDRYATEEGDYQSAVRCYRDALDLGSGKDLAIAPGDSWLLMVLKNARQKEKRDANRIR